MAIWKSVQIITAAGAVGLCVFACASKPIASGPLLAIAANNSTFCDLNESATTGLGTYSANVDLTASVALLGDTGVDVVMTPQGAIAATNTTNGALLHWVDPNTGEIRRAVSLPSTVSDIAFDGGATLVVASINTLTRLDSITGETLSQVTLPAVKRVAISPDGHLAALANKTVHLFDGDNQEIFSRLRDYTGVTDVEVRSCNGQQTVYVTSFRNATFTDLNDRRNPVQIARLEALDFTGEVQWSLFGDRLETIKQNVADTRLYRVTLGHDGYLYIAGESAGTATIFRWRGEPMSEAEQFGQTAPFLSRIDPHSQLHNSGSAHLPYYARVHPTEGRLINAQMSFPRKSDTKANAMRLGDIAASADGSLYFGGAASASIANRESLTLNSVPVGDYDGRDRAWMAIAPNFQTREFWTVLAAEGGKGIVRGVDAGYGYSAALSNVESGTVPVTTGATEGNVYLSFITD